MSMLHAQHALRKCPTRHDRSSLPTHPRPGRGDEERARQSGHRLNHRAKTHLPAISSLGSLHVPSSNTRCLLSLEFGRCLPRTPVKSMQTEAENKSEATCCAACLWPWELAALPLLLSSVSSLGPSCFRVSAIHGRGNGPRNEPQSRTRGTRPLPLRSRGKGCMVGGRLHALAGYNACGVISSSMCARGKKVHFRPMRLMARFTRTTWKSSW